MVLTATSAQPKTSEQPNPSLHTNTNTDNLLAKITPMNFKEFTKRCTLQSMDDISHSDYLTNIKKSGIPVEITEVYPKPSSFNQAWMQLAEHVKNAAPKLSHINRNDLLKALIDEKPGRFLIENFARILCVLSYDSQQMQFQPEDLFELRQVAQKFDSNNPGQGEPHFQKCADALAQQTLTAGEQHFDNAYANSKMTGDILATTEKAKIQQALDQALSESKPHKEEARIYLNALAASGRLSKVFPGEEGSKLLKQLSSQLDKEAGFFKKAYVEHLQEYLPEQLNSLYCELGQLMETMLQNAE